MVVGQRRCLQEVRVYVAEIRGTRVGPRTTSNKELTGKLTITPVPKSSLTFQEEQVLYYLLFIRKRYVPSPV